MNKCDGNDYLNKGNKLCKDEPVLNPLDVGGLGQPGHNADEQGGRGQHHRQVHRDCRVEEVWQAKERSGKAEANQEKRGEEGLHGFRGESTLQNDLHLDLTLAYLEKTWRSFLTLSRQWLLKT